MICACGADDVALLRPEFKKRRFQMIDDRFHDVLSRIPGHSMARLSELMPHHWKPLASAAQV